MTIREALECPFEDFRDGLGLLLECRSLATIMVGIDLLIHVVVDSIPNSMQKKETSIAYKIVDIHADFCQKWWTRWWEETEEEEGHER